MGLSSAQACSQHGREGASSTSDAFAPLKALITNWLCSNPEHGAVPAMLLSIPSHVDYFFLSCHQAAAEGSG